MESNEYQPFFRSKRRGFHYYVQGMMKEISKAYAEEIKRMDMVMKKQEVYIIIRD